MCMSYFVYVYNSNDGVPFYVGKGNRQRHLYRRNHSVTPPSKEHIQVFNCETEEEAFEMEIFLIDFFKRELDGGTLSNLSLGGPGCRGYKTPGANKPRGPYKQKIKPPTTPCILERPNLHSY